MSGEVESNLSLAEQVEQAANEVCDAVNEFVSAVGPRVMEYDSFVLVSRGDWEDLVWAVRKHRRVSRAFLAEQAKAGQVVL